MPSAPPREEFTTTVLPRYRDIEGWLSDDQAQRLWHAARRCPRAGRIVEIGSFRGRSTVVLAAGAPAGVEVVAIDPHAGNDRGPQELEGYATQASADAEAFAANLAASGVADRVRHVRRPSTAAHGDVEGLVDVLYVDGAHRFAPARRDLAEWGRRVAPGGTLLVHDSFSSVGVTLALLAELVPSARFRYVGRSRSLAEYRCEPLRDPLDRLGNAARQLAQLPWFVRNLALKVALSAGLGTVLRRLGRPVPEWPY